MGTLAEKRSTDSDYVPFFVLCIRVYFIQSYYVH